MKKWVKTLPLTAAAVLLSGMVFLSGCGGSEAEAVEVETEEIEAEEIEASIDMSTILNGIYIGDLDVGGMTSAQASAAVRSYVQDISQQDVTLAANEESIKTTVEELGFEEDVDSTIEEALDYGRTGNVLRRYKAMKDLEVDSKVLPLVMTADEEQVRGYLEDNVWMLNRAAADYGLTREDGEFVITEGHSGQKVDVDESVKTIMTVFASGWQENTVIQLNVEVVEPRGSYEELSLVQDVLGKFSTDYSSSSSARKTNIKVGAGYLDGTVVYPGETFSVESAVVPFDEEHGYEEAPSYENGTTVDSYGGGICQVSTTLYNALIRAELDIVERHGHSMTVSYVDPSADAAIAAGTKDLQFTNNTDAPIYISGYTDGETISFTIYGHETRPSNRSVSFESETTDTTDPTVEYKASGAEFGAIELVQNSHTGKEAQLWKIVTVDGVEESREVFNHTTYEMSPTIYEVGVTSDNAEAVNALYEAIATQDPDTIYDTIYAYTSGGSSDDDYDYDEPSGTEEETDAEDEEVLSDGDGGETYDDSSDGDDEWESDE